MNARNAAGTKSAWGDMMTPVQDIKAGDVFQYICDWDILGKPIMSMPITASEDAFSVGARVFIPFGGDCGRTFTADYGSTVEKF